MKQSPDQITIIDVRNPDEYADKYIPGAINIPLDELESCLHELSKQAIIITACGKGGGRSAAAAEKLKQRGFTKAIFLCGGTFGWYDAIKQ
ncbi:MAG: rhodanese-like domain-containing protein [Ferruginibacter sp.]